MLCQAYTALRWGIARHRRGDQQIGLEVLPHEDDHARALMGLDEETFDVCWDDVWDETWLAHWRANTPTDVDTLALMGVGPAELAFLATDEDLEERFPHWLDEEGQAAG
jgi:hypothetical protein